MHLVGAAVAVAVVVSAVGAEAVATSIKCEEPRSDLAEKTGCGKRIGHALLASGHRELLGGISVAFGR